MGELSPNKGGGHILQVGTRLRYLIWLTMTQFCPPPMRGTVTRLHKDIMIIAHLFSCLPDTGLFAALVDFRECSQEVMNPGD